MQERTGNGSQKGTQIITQRVYFETTIRRNCQHIANPITMKELGKIVAQCGYEMLILCTPDKFFGEPFHA